MSVKHLFEVVNNLDCCGPFWLSIQMQVNLKFYRIKGSLRMAI